MAEKEAETDRKKATVEAQKNADVAKIQMAKELMEGEAKQKVGGC